MKTRKYGSIPHLSTSKLTQQADKKITMGQELILTKQARDYKDLIIVTEKLDGANMSVVCKDDILIPSTRSGYRAIDSKYKHHQLFYKYIESTIDKYWLFDGWSIHGEWMLKSHGTIYNISDTEGVFLIFDIIDDKGQRLPYIDMIKYCAQNDLDTVPLIHIGQPVSIKNALKLNKNPWGSPEKSEGLVYRVEREGKVDFLAKWVRDDKEDGKYMKDEIYNKGTIIEKLLSIPYRE